MRFFNHSFVFSLGGGSLSSAQDFHQFSSSSRLERDHDRGGDDHSAEERKERHRRPAIQEDEDEEDDEKEEDKDEEEEEEEEEDVRKCGSTVYELKRRHMVRALIAPNSILEPFFLVDFQT